MLGPFNLYSGISKKYIIVESAFLYTHAHTHTHIDRWNLWSKVRRSQNSWAVSSIWKSEACAESDLNKLECLLHCMSFQVSRIRLNILQYRHERNITQQNWHIYPTVIWFWVENWLIGAIPSYFIIGQFSLSSKQRKKNTRVNLSTTCHIWSVLCCNASIYLEGLILFSFQQWGHPSVTPSRPHEGGKRGDKLS